MDATEQAGRRLLQADRIAARAVVVPEGEDPTPYLLEAGIIEPIRLHFSAASDGGSAGSMGDGVTPGVEATLVFDTDVEAPDQTGADDEPPDNRRQTKDDTFEEPPEGRTANLPDAFGMKTMAPVPRRR